MSKLSKSFITPIFIGIVSFFILYFFFPSFSDKYLGFAYNKGDVTTTLSQGGEVLDEKTQQSIDSLKSSLTSDTMQNLLDSGMQKGSAVVNSVKDAVQ